ncbi:MAG: hypothetical protein U9N76_08700 [Candidatus Marinimicrobia bacterium]|nr:hypothetical protein [Candidatus Neomarinimicrobiota bacterium]
MKKIKYYIFAFVIGILLFSCTNVDDNLFVIKVDSLNHPTSIAVNDTITFKLFGIIGNNGCYSFSHFDDQIEPLVVDLTVWGNLPTSGGCPDMIVYLNKEYKIATTQKGTFFIRIHQPDDSILIDSVSVE